ncbi:hypothetical protein PG985_009812 [Apiospora marii]|uniref:uncharacterized protein n=1 Tax=Apiospora marii TaxID=335849 RepID=UPI00312CFA83
MTLATFANLNADVLHLIVDELFRIHPWTSPAQEANMSRRCLVELMRLNRNTYSALRHRLYRHIRVSSTRSLALLVRTLLERNDLRGVPYSFAAVPTWGKRAVNVDELLWAEVARSGTGEAGDSRIRRVLDVIANNNNAKDGGGHHGVPIANLFMAAFHLMTNLQSVSVTQPVLVSMDPEWLASLVASIRQLDSEGPRRAPLHQLEIVMKKVRPPVSPGTLASLDLTSVESLAVDFGKSDTYLALAELPTLDLPNLTRLKLTQNTHRDRNVLHQIPSLYAGKEKRAADDDSSRPGLKELWLRQKEWPAGPELEQTLHNCRATLETLRLDTLGPSFACPQLLLPSLLPQLSRLEHLDVDAGMLWPALYEWRYTYHADGPATWEGPADAPLEAVLPRSLRRLRVAYGSTWTQRWGTQRRMRQILESLARLVEDHAGGGGGDGLYPQLRELECWTKRRPEDGWACGRGVEWRDLGKETLEPVVAACARNGVRFRGNYGPNARALPLFHPPISLLAFR